MNERTKTFPVPRHLDLAAFVHFVNECRYAVHHIGGRRVSVDAQFMLSPSQWGDFINGLFDEFKEQYK